MGTISNTYRNEKVPPRAAKPGDLLAKAFHSDFLIKAFVVLVLFLSTGALIQLLTRPRLTSIEPNTHDPVQGDFISQVMWLAIYAIIFLLILRHRRRFIRAAIRDKFLFLLVGLAPVSILWSAAPGITLRHSVALVGTTLVGVYLATRYSLREQLWLLAWALGIAALLSLVFGLALPTYGLDPFDPLGGWQGIFGAGKNALGRNMALGALIFLLLAVSDPRYRRVACGGFALMVGLLLLSNSQTAFVSFAAILIFLLAYRALRLPYTLAIPCLIVLLLAAGGAVLWIADDLQNALSAVQRDATLSNRTEIWPAVLDMIWQRPWLGYGYGAFWLGWEGESAHVWLWNRSIGLGAEHAHNGLLDLWLNLGLLGVFTFGFGYLLAVQRGITWIRLTKTAAGLWPLAYITFMALYNTTESAILKQNDVFWILYVAAVLSTVVRPSRAGSSDSVAASLSRGTGAKTVRSLSQGNL